MDPNLFFPAILGIDAWIPLWEVLGGSPQDPNLLNLFTAGLAHALPVHAQSVVPQLLLVRPASLAYNETAAESVHRYQELCILISWPDERLPSIRVCLLPWQQAEPTAALLDISLLASAGQNVPLHHQGLAKLFRLTVDTSHIQASPPIPLMLALMQDTPDAINIASDAAASFRLLVGQPTSDKEAIAALATTILSLPQLYHMASCVAVPASFATELDALWQAGVHEMTLQEQHDDALNLPHMAMQAVHGASNVAVATGQSVLFPEQTLMATRAASAPSSPAIVGETAALIESSMPPASQNIPPPTLPSTASLPASDLLSHGVINLEPVATVQTAQVHGYPAILTVGMGAVFPEYGIGSSSMAVPSAPEHPTEATSTSIVPSIVPLGSALAPTDTTKQLELQSRFWTCHFMAFMADMAALMQCCNELKLLRTLQQQAVSLESPHDVMASSNVAMHGDASHDAATTATRVDTEHRDVATSSRTHAAGETHIVHQLYAPEPQGPEAAYVRKPLNPLELQLLTVSLRTLMVCNTISEFFHSHPVSVPILRNYIHSCGKDILDTLMSITQRHDALPLVTATATMMHPTASAQSPFVTAAQLPVTQEVAERVAAEPYTRSSTATQGPSHASTAQAGSSGIPGPSRLGSVMQSSVSTSLSLPTDLLQPVQFSGSGIADVANAPGNVVRASRDQTANVPAVALPHVSVADERTVQEVGLPPSPVRHSLEIQPSISSALLQPEQAGLDTAVTQDVMVPETAGLIGLLKAVAFGFEKKHIEKEYLQDLAQKLHRHDYILFLLHVFLLPVLVLVADNGWKDVLQPKERWRSWCITVLLIFCKMISFTPGFLPKPITSKFTHHHNGRALTIRTKLQAASLLLELSIWMLQFWAPGRLVKTRSADMAQELWLVYDAALRPFCTQAPYHQLWPLLALIPFATLPANTARTDTTFLLHAAAAIMLLGVTALCDAFHRRAFCLSRTRQRMHIE